MGGVIWTIPALNDLERILEYIELDNESAANLLAQRIFKATDTLSDFPESGARPKELIGTPYRRKTVGFILIYYRTEGEHVYIVHIRRGEREFRLENIYRIDD